MTGTNGRQHAHMSNRLPSYIGFAGLWRLELSGMQIARLGPLLEARLARNPSDAETMMDIATLSILTLIPQNREVAFAMQARALDLQRVYCLEASRQPAALRVLAIVSPGDMTAITHLDCMLEDSDVELHMLYARHGHPLPAELPEHDLVFVAIGESADNRPLLEQAAQFAQTSTQPVINSPDRILELSRETVSQKLRMVAGTVMPETIKVDRERLQQVSRSEMPIAALFHDAAFPVIVRPVGSQGGKDLAKVDGPATLAAYLEATTGGEFFIASFIDYSGSGGMFRKFRVVMIDGRPFACHMAISEHWMIHYVNADMDASAWKREEEARFMAGFDESFALKHERALKGIDAMMGLEYYAIDCAETADGALLIFEVDTAMLVHAMDPVELYPYKQPQMRKVFEAFHLMLKARITQAAK